MSSSSAPEDSKTAHDPTTSAGYAEYVFNCLYLIFCSDVSVSSLIKDYLFPPSPLTLYDTLLKQVDAAMKCHDTSHIIMTLLFRPYILEIMRNIKIHFNVPYGLLQKGLEIIVQVPRAYQHNWCWMTKQEMIKNFLGIFKLPVVKCNTPLYDTIGLYENPSISSENFDMIHIVLALPEFGLDMKSFAIWVGTERDPHQCTSYTDITAMSYLYRNDTRFYLIEPESYTDVDIKNDVYLYVKDEFVVGMKSKKILLYNQSKVFSTPAPKPLPLPGYESVEVDDASDSSASESL